MIGEDDYRVRVCSPGERPWWSHWQSEVSAIVLAQIYSDSGSEVRIESTPFPGWGRTGLCDVCHRRPTVMPGADVCEPCFLKEAP